MTPEEAKKMVGTEFIYEFEDGDEIPAYVKAIDVDDWKMSCFSLETETKRGWKPDPGVKNLEKDGTFCVISSRDRHLSLIDLRSISETGRVSEISIDGCAAKNFSCAFS